MTQIPKTSFEDPAWLKSMKDRGCLICAEPAIGHHIGKRNPRNDKWAVPLCSQHHQGHPESVHSANREAVWWAENAPDIVMAGLKIWAEQFYGENK